MGSLPVSPPASDQTPGGSFPLTKKAALLGSLLQTREALQLVRSPVRRTHTDNSTERRRSCLYAGIKRYYLFVPFWITTYTVTPSAVYTRRYFVTNGDRILELVVSTSLCGVIERTVAYLMCST